MKKHTISALLLALVLPVSAQAADDKVIKLATTTSTDNSGLLAYLLPTFEEKTGYQVQVIATGTGKALRHGRNGDVDVVMTHAPAAEAQFVEDGYGRVPRQLMANDFVILGPKADPAGLSQLDSAVKAFKVIAEQQRPFVSRGDESGTHMKELALWQQAGVATDFTGYSAIGQGMGPAMLTASEMEAYVLADRGTYLAFMERLQLEVVHEGDDSLLNPYQVILVSETHYPDLNHAGAEAFSDWLVSEEGQQMIDSFTINGQRLFQATYQQ
ncbi:substrate-binding domain-containing protein [Ferrimonas marina]|uniref:Tungstate transport system substrate-binding protein n=1 Tax=Ferrimonas marina TaxID=299255 RepID=A0A1M5ZEK0_9GAMM|nr:substrate-binding domain-containing protein [Ferrimonas marina]SHI22685.1 tungstate transport system substrate-binding protein [Ferrimonas marina]